MDDGSNVQKIEATCRILADAESFIDESHALSFALTVTLASSPREDLSQDEIDKLCQSAYELFCRQKKVRELLYAVVEELRCKS